MKQMANEVESTGRITLEDVRKLLTTTATDPRKTNSGAVRKQLGRGSMGTIQNHLATLRAELEPKPLALTGSIPSVPKELCESLWQAAWTASQASTSSALATALLERDTARALLLSALEDLSSANTDGDAALLAASEAERSAVIAELSAQAARTGLETFKAESATAELNAQQKLCTAIVNHDSLMDRLNAGHDLEVSKYQTQIATYNGIIDRMTEQLSEVKSLLPRSHENAKN